MSTINEMNEDQAILQNEETAVPAEAEPADRVPTRRENDIILWELDEDGTLTLSTPLRPKKKSKDAAADENAPAAAPDTTPAAAPAPTTGEEGEKPAEGENADKAAPSLVAMSDFYVGDYPPPPWHDFKDKIRSLVVKEGITELGARAFEDCVNLTDVELPRTMRRIHFGCFSGCTSLIDIEIILRGRMIHMSEFMNEQTEEEDRGDHQTIQIGMHAFCRTPWALEAFGEFYIVDGTLYDYYGDSDEIVIPDGVDTIGRFAFSGLGIKRVTLPQTVTTIGLCAFEDNDLTEIVFPAQQPGGAPLFVRALAFHNNPRLSRVVIPDLEGSHIERNAFLGTNFLLPLKESEKPPVLYKITLTRNKAVAGTSRIEVRENENGVPEANLGIGKNMLKRLRQGAVILRIEPNLAKLTIGRAVTFSYDKDEADHVCVTVWYPAEPGSGAAADFGRTSLYQGESTRPYGKDDAFADDFASIEDDEVFQIKKEAYSVEALCAVIDDWANRHRNFRRLRTDEF